MKLEKVVPIIAVKGAGDLATGVMHRLRQAGFRVMASELAQPTVLRRTVAFAEAVTQGRITVEGITACRVATHDEVLQAFERGEVPVVVDPDGAFTRSIQPTVLVEATLTKYNSGIRIHDAPIVIALGPGYEAGKDVHAVIETNRGHNLGRVYVQGCAEPDTGVPGAIGGYTAERLLRAPCAGFLYGLHQIGDQVEAGEIIAQVKEGETSSPILAAIPGILRGLVRDGLPVSPGMKVGDIDPRAAREHCFAISDKSRAVGGGVLEAVMYFLRAL